MTDDITWALAYLEDDAKLCSIINGARDATTKDARRLETTFKRLARERDAARAEVEAMNAALGGLLNCPCIVGVRYVEPA